MKVLVTGGAGYVGATVASACADAGIEPILLDDLSTGSSTAARRFCFYQGDYADPELVALILRNHRDLDAVVHCAARVSVPDSVLDPLGYHATNVAGLPGFIAALASAGCDRIVFSSSASIYDPATGPVLTEESPLRPHSPYAASKAMGERILGDAAQAGLIRGVALRYFNPIGADPGLRSGNRQPYPPHVLGRLMQAARESEPFVLAAATGQPRTGRRSVTTSMSGTSRSLMWPR